MKLPIIRGFNNSSEAGNDLFAPSMFLQGCNLRCPYCMNGKLVNCEVEAIVPIEEIKEKVKDTHPEIIMISGGEATNEPLLKNLIDEIKSWDCYVGLSTNGINCETLRSVIGLLNYVALDIKSPDDKTYKDIGSKDGIIPVIISKSLVVAEKMKRKDFDFEIRTTLYPPFINKDSLNDIGTLMRGNERWVLQQFRPSHDFFGGDVDDVSPYEHDELQDLLKIAKNYTSKACIKHV